MKQTILDLQDDFTKLLSLAQSARERVLEHQLFLQKFPHYFQPSSLARLLETSRSLNDSYQEAIINLQKLTQLPAEADLSAAQEYIFQKYQSTHLLRILQSELGSLLSAGDWQSPTFNYTLLPLSGKQTGMIEGNETDYKRDFHYDAQDYEKLFVAEYVDAGMHLSPRALVTSSGMSAFLTVVEHLRLRMEVAGPILVGRACYFENQWILERAFPGQIRYFNEFETDEAIELAKKIKPAAVFIDTLGNTEAIPVPDLQRLMPELAKCLPRNCVLVIDNSAMATSCQPLKYLPLLVHPHYFVIESLNKYHQFGMDRVTGGVIWCTGFDLTTIKTTRVHLGTIMPDFSVLCLPRPNRMLLDKQLQRFERNALMLAQALEDELTKKPHPLISGIVYPGLKSYRGYSWTKSNSFHGSFFTFTFHPHQRNVKVYLKLIESIMTQARQDQVNLVAGTSFGMDVTRLYLTAKNAGELTVPFVRVSAGTESHLEMQKLIDTFRKALWPEAKSE